MAFDHDPLWQRWVINIALFYGAVIAAGLFAGFLGAIGANFVNSGMPGPFSSPRPELLLLIPLHLVWLTTLFLLPVVVVLLVLAEIAALLGAPRQALQNAALGIAVVPSLLLLATRGMEILSTVALAMTALAFLLRLPDGRSIPLWRRGRSKVLVTQGEGP
ncbi:MAG TPA: hypothetical protein VK889_07070 [Solirubrobacterales bacterium]|nr:hypothetical protein [Solirubrobacterales bacterium]